MIRTLVAAASLFASATAWGDSVAYIATKGNGIQAIDTVTRQTLSTINTNGAGYAGLAVSRDGRLLFAAAYGSSVDVFDTVTGDKLTFVPVGLYPTYIVLSPDGSTLYVTTVAASTVYVVNTSTFTVTATFDTQQSGVYGAAISPDGKTLYLNNFGADTVSVVNTASNTVTANIAMGLCSPDGIAVSPDGAHAYVACANGNTVDVIDAASATVTAKIALPPQSGPQGIAITPDGKFLYVACSQTNSVALFETASASYLESIPVGTNPLGIEVTPDGSSVFVINMDSSSYSVIDAATATLTATVATPSPPLSFGQFIGPSPPAGGLAEQTIVPIFNVSNLAVGSSGIMIANSSSGLPVTISSATPAICQVANTNFVTGLAQGTCDIRMTQAGNSSFAAAQIDYTVPVVVSMPISSIAIASSPNPSIVGQIVTFTATINPASGAPNGSVTFYAGGSGIGLIPVNGTTVIFQDTALNAGNYQITAAYNGGSGNGGVTSQILDQTVNPLLIQTGYWWNPAEGGRGFTIERNVTSGNMFVAAYLYAADGAPMWYSAGPATMNAYVFTAPLTAYQGGQTLGGAWQAPSTGTSPGNLVIDFTDTQNATLTWPGGTIPITRFAFESGGLSAPASVTQPQPGYWYNPAEPGRGYTIEVQDNTAFIAAYMYDASGNPVWYASGPVALTSGNTYQGELAEFSGGQTLTGMYQAPTGVANAGNITIQFSSPTVGTLTLPDGNQIPIQRFAF